MPLFNKQVNKEEVEKEPKQKRQFIVVSQDFSGMGWAKIIKDNGDDVILAYKLERGDDKAKEAKMVGQGIIPTDTLDSLFSERAKHKSALWIFDMNYHSEYAEKLRKEGFKVFGGQKISSKMENDRHMATEVVEGYGLKTPPTTEFSSLDKGIAFLDQNPDKAYVFKPDGSAESWATFVPDSERDTDANRELHTYLSSLGTDTGKYILQERIKGVELNVEVWFYKGTPFFSFANFECKRKLNHDYGCNTGCAMDIGFTVDLDQRVVTETIGKMFPFYEEIKYTGFADVNVIICNNQPYFLEVCNRFGYNSHPNLFLTLAKDSFNNIIWDFAHGEIQNFKERFNYGFGASILMYLDNTRAGLPVYISEDVDKKFYLYDGYKEDKKIFLTGYSNEVGIITGHGYTIKEAAEAALKNADKVNFPMRSIRSDLDRNDYPSAPLGRYDALVAMQYLKQ